MPRTGAVGEGRRMRALLLLALALAADVPPPPSQVYGPLFDAVQRARPYADEKAFVDAIPLRPPEEILAAFARARERPGFDLAAFLRENFAAPRPQADVRAHIEGLWFFLERRADHPTQGGSLLPLPRPYVVPGGRFEEFYYWDSYFVMLGLAASGRWNRVEDMVENAAHLIATYGFVPNGSRSYYLTRSQPPFFALMLDVLAEHRGPAVYGHYREALEREYAFWMDPARGHAVSVGERTLNRYHDAADVPRDEQAATDCATAATVSAKDRPALYRDLRSAAESGWDFSSRWFADGKTRGSIRTTRILPVDLHALLAHLEQTLARARRQAGDEAGARALDAAVADRRAALDEVFWSDSLGWYVDADLEGRPLATPTLAGMMPLFLGLVPPERAAVVAKTLRARFLRPGGLVTTGNHTGEQWDAPNGWAPLQWISIEGLRRYDEEALAADVARRWIRLNLRVYRETGKLVEKYDVENPTRPGGGGEYPTQDGFGWTNGVLLRLLQRYGEPPPEPDRDMTQLPLPSAGR